MKYLIIGLQNTGLRFISSRLLTANESVPHISFQPPWFLIIVSTLKKLISVDCKWHWSPVTDQYFTLEPCGRTHRTSAGRFDLSCYDRRKKCLAEPVRMFGRPHIYCLYLNLFTFHCLWQQITTTKTVDVDETQISRVSYNVIQLTDQHS